MTAHSSPADVLGEARRALAAGDHASARGLHERAAAAAPYDIQAWIGLAASCRAAGDLPAALEAIDRALALDARLFPALLMRASLLERQGEARQAALAYGAALTQAPADDRLDPATRHAVAHARDVNRRHVDGLEAALRAGVPDAAVGGSRRRAEEFIAHVVGRRRRYAQEPSEFFYPDLPAIEFYDREMFDWIDAFERETPAILAELAAVLGGTAAEELTPYIDYQESVPLDQWRALNRSKRWSAYHFYSYGAAHPDHLAACPATAAAIARLPQPQLPGRSPAAMFSVLQPHTRIPPHTGVANTRLVVHLPLILPSDCGFRVGNTTRQWELGRAWVFDDTIEHEAWNDSPQERTILICDIWNPLIPEGERGMIEQVMATIDGYDRA